MLFIIKVSVLFGALCLPGASANFLELVGEAFSPLMRSGKALMRAVKAHEHSHHVQMSVDQSGAVQQVIQQYQIGEGDGPADGTGYMFLPAFYDVTETAATPRGFIGASFESAPQCFVSLAGSPPDPVTLEYGPMPKVGVDSNVQLGGRYNGVTTYQIFKKGTKNCMVPDNSSNMILLENCGNVTESGLWYFVCGDRTNPGLIQLQWLGENQTELCFQVGPDFDANNNTILVNAPTPDGNSCGIQTETETETMTYEYFIPHMTVCQFSLLGVNSSSVQAIRTTLSHYSCGSQPFASFF